MFLYAKLKQWYQVSCKDFFYAWHFLTRSFQGRESDCDVSLALASHSGIVISSVMVLERYGALPLQMAFVTCVLSGNTWTREWKEKRSKHFCGKVGRPAPNSMLFGVHFVFDFKACLKYSHRKIHLPRNSSILNKEKNLGIPHSLLHPLPVKSVGTEQ